MPWVGRSYQDVPEVVKKCQKVSGDTRGCQELAGIGRSCQDVPGVVKKGQKVSGDTRGCQ